VSGFSAVDVNHDILAGLKKYILPDRTIEEKIILREIQVYFRVTLDLIG
jgi:hypothetical protein